nr:MAG TPA: hypothetical protein [Caudoviricetes sp.]
MLYMFPYSLDYIFHYSIKNKSLLFVGIFP